MTVEMIDAGGQEVIRESSLEQLVSQGFQVSPGLPLWTHWTLEPIRLRPTLEIVQRLMASEIITSYLWSMNAPEEELRNYIQRSDLQSAMTPFELDIINSPREEAAEAHRDNDGWRQENQWALAWILGFGQEIGVHDGPITGDVCGPLVQEFMPKLSQTDQDFLDAVTPRPLSEVAAKFDLFYAAHNAVRSAQQGAETVPEGFDPVFDGGVLHEKRHALTWAVSPGVDWDDTDLST